MASPIDKRNEADSAFMKFCEARLDDPTFLYDSKTGKMEYVWNSPSYTEHRISASRVDPREHPCGDSDVLHVVYTKKDTLTDHVDLKMMCTMKKIGALFNAIESDRVVLSTV